jgi:PPOX class probable F420-dependent enzyme
MSPRKDVSMTPAEIEEFLRTPRTAVLSSIAADGGPHSAGMWFVADGGAIRMWTYAKSQKAVNLRRDARAAFLVEEGNDYSDLRGVLVRGRVDIVTAFDDVVAIGKELYARYTEPRLGIPVDGEPLEEIERQAHKRVGLVLPLLDVASWDHSRL